MDVLMPQLGETVAEGKISKWFVKAGDAVKPGDNLFEIETDKVSMEVPAIAAGTLAAIHVQAGEIAPVGAVVAVIQGKGETVSTAASLTSAHPRESGSPEPREQELDSRLRGDERQATPKPAAARWSRSARCARPSATTAPRGLPGGTVVTPLARRLAGEAGIDLANIKGSGPHGRIVARDIETARSAKAPALAQPQATRTSSSPRMSRSAQSLALCAEVMQRRSSSRDVIVKAWATALAARHCPTEQTAIALADRQRPRR